MAFKIEDRVKESTVTTGTGTLTLAAAVTNFERFSANLSNSDTTYYAIVDNTNNAFEVGLGTYSSNTLARGTIFASSNSNNLVDFGVGTKEVFITVPASKIVVEDGSNNVAIGGTVTATGFSGSGASLTGVDVVNDTSPQLGGNLDVNGNDIISASGNANIEVAPHGTGGLVVKGNNTGSENQGKIILNCQNNSHGQTLKSQPHSASASNTLLLPSGSNDGSAQALVAVDITQTLTNKTLTSPVIETVTGSTITLDSAGDITLDAGGADVTLKDDGTTYGSLTNSSGELVVKSGSTPTTAMTFSGANVTLAGNLTVNGTTTTVNSTTLTVDDPIITLGGDSAPGSDDNKDRGVEFRYHTGSAAKVGFFGFDDSGTTFTFIPDATNNSEVFSGSVGNVAFGIGTFSSLDISGDVDVDGTLEADAITLNDVAVTSTATLSTGISNGNVLVANANVVDNDFLRVDGTSIEGRSASELATDIGAATTDDATALAIALG
ncbi:MAG: hypothetical protein CBC71_06010 [Rhodobacteraceae bacterium TMED111]|nr:MAG: hypothetical protein CBC71_06010 [Rhodobacteraceae bacterium TMED111]|tara:strand:+ start:4124 stop:5605 length:1482 start_codon:yes stop_codon:yes gene_type:complete